MSTELTVAALFEGMTALTTSLNRVAENQERLLAGQQAALDKIEGGKATTTRTRRTKADDAAEQTPAAEQVQPEPEPVKSFLPDVTDEASLKAYVSAWTGAVEGADRAKRVELLKAISAHFGVEPKFAPLSADAARLKQVLFFIERSKAGQPVDFGADYDFAGDPAQGAAAADESDFG